MSSLFPAAEIEQSIAERFEKQVAAYPDRVAVQCRDTRMTYAELNAAANRLARAILEAAGKTERVVLLYEQGAPVLVAVLAVLKAGKTYVPLDPTSPVARLSELVTDAEAGLILTTDRHLSLAEELVRADSPALLNVDSVDDDGPTHNLGLPISPDSLAYMLYTSGSTGGPKGVVQRHRNLLHFVRTYSNNLVITPEDRIAWLHSITFSASNMNVYPALLNGATLLPYDVKSRGVLELGALLSAEGVTICQCVPTVLRHFLASLPVGERFPALRLFELAGEPLFRRDVELLRRHLDPHCLLVNRLAFTEASVAAQYFIPAETELTGNAIPVGRPVGDMEIMLLDDEGNPVGGPDQVGEITLRSQFLSPGYWRRPDLTTKAFSNEGNNGSGPRRYRSGDLGRFRNDGLLEYTGRKDFRVKIRGYTIEVAEVEAALLALKSFQQAVVIAREDGNEDLRLVAYLVPANGAVLNELELRARLTERLPDYMIPAVFVMLDALPVTRTGKLDRRALPDPATTRSARGNGRVPPRTAAEERMVAIWQEVFKLEGVGITDDFFALGGHSLLAGQVVARIRQTFGVEMSPSTLFNATTVAELCNIVQGLTSDPAEPVSAETDKLHR